MKHLLATILFVAAFLLAPAQERINPSGIDIVRDSFGVPHIFANTDAEVAYGLAYAHSEDDFKTIQLGFLAGKSMLGLYKGKEGAKIDYITQLLRCRNIVEEKYEKDISAGYKKVLEGYCQGFNAYAGRHPEEVLVKKSLPLTPIDILSYSVLQLAVSCGADKALGQIYNGSIPILNEMAPGGSNAYAFNGAKTTDGNAYLNINAHQPLEGPVSWYEAHLCSKEGWNIIGALFPCAPNILLGCNENLGWAHTVNYPDKLDVFQLQVNPNNKIEYNIDGKWEQLEVKKVKLKIKIAGLTVSVKRKIYRSLYGPAIVTKKGTFSIRTAPLFDIRALEQWYRMNKATSFTDFYRALKMEALPGYNVVYADRFDTIFYLSNGKIPLRDKNYNWTGTVPGNTSKTLWNKYHPLEDLPQYLNPSSGYLFNSNHSPYNASSKENNLNQQNFDATMGYETWENNRSVRFMHLLQPLNRVSYEDFKKIKFDRSLPEQLHYIGTNADTLFMLNENDHPGIADMIITLRNWDKQGNIESKGAAVFSILYYYISGKITSGETRYKNITKTIAADAIGYAKNYMITNFGKTDITLGEFQKLVRGKKSIPLAGLPDVIASMECTPYKNGMVKGNQGESYIELVKFTKDGPQIESIHSYGASNKPGNKHFDDQMERFMKQELKPMTLNKESVYRSAERIYHPY